MDTGAAIARARTKIACEECRKNKRKCDGQRPTCLLCDKSGRTCTYASDTTRKRKYVDEDLLSSLQSQIYELQLELRGYRECDELHHGSLERLSQIDSEMRSEGENVNKKRQVNTSYEAIRKVPDRDPDHTHPPAVDARSYAAMEELASLMLSMDLKGQGEPSFTLPPGKFNVADEQKPPTGDKPVSRDHGVHGAFTLSLQSRKELKDCFMQRFNTFHQFLDKTEASHIIQSPHSAETGDTRFRNYALFAVGAFLSDDPDASDLGSELAGCAESMVLQCIRQSSSDLITQGLALLAWRELMLGNDSMAYNYIAMATGVILHLGLHVSAFSPLASTNMKQNRFKQQVRSFWAYFSVDRLLTSSIGMNCTLHWQRVRASPFLNIVEGATSIDEVAHDQFCQLWHLWDSCMDQVHAFSWSELRPEERKTLVTRSHKALEDFYQGVDPRLQLRKDHMPESAVWFQMAYHAAILLIHRPFLNEPSGTSTLEFALRSATSAAASISRIIRGYRTHHGFANVAPQIIDYILSAAVIHLLNATSGRTTLGRKSANGIRSCVEALLGMQPKWKVRVQRSIERIKELAHRWKVVWALPLCLSQPLDMESQNPGPTETTSVEVKGLHENRLATPNSSQVIEADGISIGAGLWNPDEYMGALDQIHGSWGMSESWDLDILFHQDDLILGVYTSEPG